MDESDYREWIAQLPKLDQKQLEDISTRIKLLGALSVKTSTGKKDFGERVVVAICSTLNRLGVDCPSISALRGSAAYVNNKQKFVDLSAFLEKVSGQRLIQDAVLRYAIDLLYHDLLQWGVAISAHTILAQIHRIPATLNRHHPGYAASGLLEKVVNVRTEPNRGA